MFKVYRVSFSCYPRCQHAHKHLKQLSDRYDHLTEERLPKLYLPVLTHTTCRINKDKPEFHLCLHTSDKGSCLEIKDVLKRNKEWYCSATIKGESIKDVVRTKECLKKTYLVLITNETVNKNDIPQNDNLNIIIATESIEDKEKATKFYKDTENVHISLMEHIGDKVSDLMEQNIFKALNMKIKCDNLLRALNSIPKVDVRQEKSKLFGDKEPKLQFNNKHSSQQRSKSAEYIIPRANVPAQLSSRTKRSMSAKDRYLHDIIAEVSKLDLPQGRSTTAEISSKLEEEHTIMKKLRTDTSISLNENELQNENSIQGSKETFRKHVQEHIEKVERLYDEIKGMFTRSRVPKDEQPQPDKQFDGTVSDELKEDLRQLSSSIRSCGYRCRSFIVFVDDEYNPELLKPDLETIMKKHNISTFTIVPSSVKQFSSCNVGSKIAAEFDKDTVKHGTLGGFGLASSNKESKTIGLVSRHVVTVGNMHAPVLRVESEGQPIEASVLVDNSFSDRENVLDIAAASLDHIKNHLDTDYKTSEQMAAKGRLSNYCPGEMQGLHVHICGSTTPMGYGTVTMPKIEAIRDKDMGENFIIIEDRENPGTEKKAFCKEGDSGAIVCADDQENPEEVKLISMVIGENTKKPGAYYSLNLENGICQVEEETKSSIKLL